MLHCLEFLIIGTPKIDIDNGLVDGADFPKFEVVGFDIGLIGGGESGAFDSEVIAGKEGSGEVISLGYQYGFIYFPDFFSANAGVISSEAGGVFDNLGFRNSVSLDEVFEHVSRFVVIRIDVVAGDKNLGNNTFFVEGGGDVEAIF